MTYTDLHPLRTEPPLGPPDEGEYREPPVYAEDFNHEWESLIENGFHTGSEGTYMFWDVIEHMGSEIKGPLADANEEFVDALMQCCSGVTNPRHALLLVQRIQRSVEASFDHYHGVTYE